MAAIVAAHGYGLAAIGKVDFAHEVVQAAGDPVVERHAGQISYVHRVLPPVQVKLARGVSVQRLE
jgi:hypothetical protein